MEHEEDTMAFVGSLSRGPTGTISFGQLSAVGAANANVAVPHAAFGGVRVEVPLDHDGARSSAFSFEDDVRDLHCTFGVAVASSDLNDWLGVVDVVERVAICNEQGPDLASNFDRAWDRDGVFDEVGAVVEVSDRIGVGCDGLQEACDACGVVGLAVTLASSGLGRLEVAGWDVLVLWLATTVDVAIGVDQSRSLLDSRKSALCAVTGGSVAVACSRHPRLNLARLDQCTLRLARPDSGRSNSRHVDVVKYESATSERDVAGQRERRVDAIFRAADHAVSQDHRANRLVLRRCSHVKADSATSD